MVSLGQPSSKANPRLVTSDNLQQPNLHKFLLLLLVVGSNAYRVNAGVLCVSCEHASGEMLWLLDPASPTSVMKRCQWRQQQ